MSLIIKKNTTFKIPRTGSFLPSSLGGLALWLKADAGVSTSQSQYVSQIVLNIVQILFYLTPILWIEQSFKNSFFNEVFSFNPFYHLFSITRSTLLGQMPTNNNWIASIVLLIIGSIITSLFFTRFKHKIAYWL